MFDDAFVVLCGALRRNGQIHGPEIAFRDGPDTSIVVRAPRPDSLAARHASPEVGEALEKLAALCARPPTLRRIDDEPVTRIPALRKVSVLVLSTDMFDLESAVRGGGGERVPAYALPVDERVRWRLHAWTNQFRALDRLWIDSGALALAAYRQLADPRRELAVEGRALCRAIEDATRVPTFYDLYRYHGRRVSEERRRCPLCGGPFRHRHRLPWMRFFDFRCAPCRLVSNVAYSRGAPEDERHAHIGEPGPRRRRHTQQ